MKISFPEASEEHEEKIRRISEAIVNSAKDKIAFVILFGSFARGTWVRDRYREGNNVYEYASDYDFLIVKKARKKDDKENGISDSELEEKIKAEVRQAGIMINVHRPHYVIEPLNYVNSELEKGRYFFSDIKKEGILLYDSGEFKLSEPKILSQEEIRQMAREDYEHWFKSAKEFFGIYHFCINEKTYKKAAFSLHQAAEGFYNCALLVLTGYKPKSHDLEELNQLCCTQSNNFLNIFLSNTEEQKECFKLLNKSYSDARYNKHFKIAKEQLIYLESRVNLLKELVEGVCKERI